MDPDASLAFYRDTLGFEVRGDVGKGKMRRITVGPPNQPGTSMCCRRPPLAACATAWSGIPLAI